MAKIVIYFAIVAVCIVLRFAMAKQNSKHCEAPLYTSPIKTYFWQIAGMLTVFLAMSGILYFNTKHEIDAYMPNTFFVILVGILAGVCAFSVTLFAFTKVGIYKNGLLTHYMFFEFDEIESFKFSDANMLNIGRETKTVIFKIKENSSNHPSFEYPAKDEKEIRRLLEAYGIVEYVEID